jgi:hypothetical protein
MNLCRETVKTVALFCAKKLMVAGESLVVVVLCNDLTIMYLLVMSKGCSVEKKRKMNVTVGLFDHSSMEETYDALARRLLAAALTTLPGTK